MNQRLAGFADPEAGRAALVRLARECVSANTARRVLLLGLSRLPPDLSRPHHRRLARAALEPLAAADRARIYDLPGGDIAVGWRGEAGPEALATLDRLDRLFAGIPVPAGLVRALRLPRDGAALLDLIAAPGGGTTRTAALERRPLDPETVTRLETALRSADVARFVRRETVWQRNEGRMTPAWESRSLDLEELAETLSPGHDFSAAPWLRRRLGRALDRRLLALLAAPGELAGSGAFGLDLSVDAVLSPAFLRLDAALPAGRRGHGVVGLDAADLLATSSAALFARDMLHGSGWKVWVRGLTPALLAVFPPKRLGAERVELVWREDARPKIEDGLQVVLADADAAGLQWAGAQGIELFLRPALDEFGPDDDEAGAVQRHLRSGMEHAGVAAAFGENGVDQVGGAVQDRR